MFLKNGIVAAVSSSHADARQSIGLPSNPPVLHQSFQVVDDHDAGTVDKFLIGPSIGKLWLIVKVYCRVLAAGLTQRKSPSGVVSHVLQSESVWA